MAAAPGRGWWPCQACQRRFRPQDPTATATAARRRGNELCARSQFSEAVEAYSEGIRALPAEAQLYLNRSVALRRLLRWEEALRDARKAAMLEPTNTKARMAMAVALEHLGRLRDAAEACKVGLEHNPADKSLLDFRESLKKQMGAEGLDSTGTAADQTKQQLHPEREAAGVGRQKQQQQPKKRDFSIDYSKWEGIEDSDDEQEASAGATADAGSGEDGPSDKDRAYAVEQMMAMIRDARAKSAEEAKLLSAFKPADKKLDGNSLPSDYMKQVGVLSLEQLRRFSCSSDRMLASVYGDIFDVSSRPDLYGYGPKSFHAGRDVTWLLISGKDTPDNCDRFYDLFKANEEDLQRYLRVVCHYLACLREEFGPPVGRLDKYMAERLLPAPPPGEVDQCPTQ